MNIDKYNEAQSAYPFNVGDKVFIKRMPQDEELGWGQIVNEKMMKYVGKEAVVTQYDEDSDGYVLDNEYWWPFFVLENAEINQSLRDLNVGLAKQFKVGDKVSFVSRLYIEEGLSYGDTLIIDSIDSDGTIYAQGNIYGFGGDNIVPYKPLTVTSHEDDEYEVSIHGDLVTIGCTTFTKKELKKIADVLN